MLRGAADPPAARRARARRRGRRRWLAQLRVHALPPARPLLQRPPVGAHHRLGERVVAALRRGDADARGRHQPLRRAGGAADARRRPRDGGRGELSQDAGGRLLRPAGGDGGRPLLRGRGAGADGLHRVRQLHGRLPGRRQEHPGQELPRARRAARGRHPGPADRDAGPAHRPVPPRARLPGRARAHRRLGGPRPSRDDGDVCRDGGRRLRDEPPAPPAAAHRRPAAAVTGPRSAHAHQLRDDRRGRHPSRAGGHGPDQGRRHHLVLPPGPGHARRELPLRRRVQPHGWADRAARARRRTGAALRALPRRGGSRPARRRPVPVAAALERAHGHRPGDAEPRQLADDQLSARAARRALDDERAGARRAQPHLDPGRPCGAAIHRPSPGDGDGDPGRRAGQRRRGRRHADDGALPRGRRDLGRP